MFEIPSPYSRPSPSKACGWKPGTSRSQGSLPGVRRVHVAVEHQRRAAAGAPPRAERVRAVVLDLLPLHGEAHRLVQRDHQLGHPLLVAREAVDVDHRARGGDEAVAVDLHGHCRPPIPGNASSGPAAPPRPVARLRPTPRSRRRDRPHARSRARRVPRRRSSTSSRARTRARAAARGPRPPDSTSRTPDRSAIRAPSAERGSSLE